jgi:Ca2+-binding RTX toxin-like protein
MRRTEAGAARCDSTAPSAHKRQEKQEDKIMPIIYGTNKGELINFATDRNDVIFGLGGDDQIHAEGGADYIDGGTGSDSAAYSDSPTGVTVSLVTGRGYGGDAQGDTLVSIENLDGSRYNDVLTGDDGANRIWGESGADIINGRGGQDVIDGGSGNDTLKGGGGADRLYGGEGIDTASYLESGAGVFVSLEGGAGSGGDAEGDRLYRIENLTGSMHNDVLWGDDGANGFLAQDGNDTLKGFGGSDRLFGMGGNDMINGGEGADTIDGGVGVDTASYMDSTAGVSVSLATGRGNGGEAEGDTLSGIENLTGSQHADVLGGDDGANTLAGLAGNDSLSGGRGADTLDGGNGNDTLKGGGGADTLNGGADIDTASYQGSGTGVSVSLLSGAGAGGDAEGDVLNSIENLTGSLYNDTLWGNDGANELRGLGGNDTLKGFGGSDAIYGGNDQDTLMGMDGNDRLFGEQGNDTLNGGAGNDMLNGGAGRDTLTGGANNDTFVFNRGEANGDVITDFQGNGNFAGDAIQLSGYGAGATLNQVSATVWEVTSGDHLTHDFITLSNGATITSNDFSFV